MIKGSNGRHDRLIDLCRDLFISQGLPVETHLEYPKGELDLLCSGIYYEIKCNRNPKTVAKSIKQIERALQHNQANYGYLVTYGGLVDILGDGGTENVQKSRY